MATPFKFDDQFEHMVKRLNAAPMIQAHRDIWESMTKAPMTQAQREASYAWGQEQSYNRLVAQAEKRVHQKAQRVRAEAQRVRAVAEHSRRSVELKAQQAAELKRLMDSMKTELKAEMTSMKAEILLLKADINTLTEHSDMELEANLDSAIFEIDETIGSILLNDIQ
jgi:hypothetical protein